MSHSLFSSDSEGEMEEEHVKKVSQVINNNYYVHALCYV